MDGQCTRNKPTNQTKKGLYGIIRVLYGYYTGIIRVSVPQGKLKIEQKQKWQIWGKRVLYGIIRYYTGIIRVLYGYYTGERASGEIKNRTKTKMADLGKKGIIRYYTVLYGYYTGIIRVAALNHHSENKKKKKNRN